MGIQMAWNDRGRSLTLRLAEAHECFRRCAAN